MRACSGERWAPRVPQRDVRALTRSPTRTPPLLATDVTATFDGIDAGMSSIEAPRIGYKHNLEAGGNTYGLAATFVRKGNSDAKNSDDTIKLACTMPKFEGIGSKLEYDTLSKKASVTADKAFNDTKAKIKVDAKDGSVSWKATVSHPLPEGVGLTADINNKQAGTIALAKDAFTLEMPYSVSGGVTASSAKLKYKWSTTLDL